MVGGAGAGRRIGLRAAAGAPRCCRRGKLGRSRPRITAGEGRADPLEARCGEVARSDDEEIRGTLLGRSQQRRGVARRHGPDAGRTVGQGHGDMGATGKEDSPAAVARQMEAEARDHISEARGGKLLGAGKKANEPRCPCRGVARTFGGGDEGIYLMGAAKKMSK